LKKKVAIIGTNGLPAKYGGFETLVNYLTKYLSDDFEIYVYCSKNAFPKINNRKYNNSNLVYIPLNANGWQSIIYDSISILHAFSHCSALLILGPISAGYILSINLIFRKKIITNYGGIEWKREKHSYLSQLFAKLNYKIATKNTQVHIVDNDAIGLELKKDFSLNSYKIIPYGGDHVINLRGEIKFNSKYDFLNKKYICAVGRAQTDNNQHLLISVANNIPELQFVLISNWNSTEYGMKLRKNSTEIKNLYLIGPVYDQEEIDEIRSNCFIYIHSHAQSGTAPTLVEAMSLGLPIISFDSIANRKTTNDEAIYFTSEDDLTRILKNINHEDLKQIAIKMGKIASENFKWSKITEEYKQCFY